MKITGVAMTTPAITVSDSASPTSTVIARPAEADTAPGSIPVSHSSAHGADAVPAIFGCVIDAELPHPSFVQERFGLHHLDATHSSDRPASSPD